MAEIPPSPPTRPATPRWVKALALVFAIAIVVVLILMLVSGVRHGPGMHSGLADPVAASSGAPARNAGGPAGPAPASRTIHQAAR